MGDAFEFIRRRCLILLFSPGNHHYKFNHMVVDVPATDFMLPWVFDTLRWMIHIDHLDDKTLENSFQRVQFCIKKGSISGFFWKIALLTIQKVKARLSDFFNFLY
jgi:hypothetical protein